MVRAGGSTGVASTGRGPSGASTGSRTVRIEPVGLGDLGLRQLPVAARHLRQLFGLGLFASRPSRPLGRLGLQPIRARRPARRFLPMPGGVDLPLRSVVPAEQPPGQDTAQDEDEQHDDRDDLSRNHVLPYPPEPPANRATAASSAVGRVVRVA